MNNDIIIKNLGIKMKKFKQEGLYILPEGYFISSWCVDKQKYISKKLKLNEIETHLNTVVYLGKNVRLKHLLAPLLSSKIFSIIYKRDFWDEMVYELNSHPWKEWIGDTLTKKDGDDIEYLEVYSHIEYSEKENKIYQIPSRLYFHGIAYAYTTKKKAKLTHSKVGDKISFSLSANPIYNYMNTPLRIGKYSLDKTTKEYKIAHLIKEIKMNISLGTLIYSILWDMSFYGAGESREKFVNSIS